MSETTQTRLLIIGPPGAGKGTQAARIAERYDVPALSTGDISRANIQGGTELGQQVQAIINAGELVPDSLTNEIVRDRLNEELLKLWARTGKTIGFVTHSIPEAVYLSTKIVVMSPRPGRISEIVSVGLPRERKLGDLSEAGDVLARIRGPVVAVAMSTSTRTNSRCCSNARSASPEDAPTVWSCSRYRTGALRRSPRAAVAIPPLSHANSMPTTQRRRRSAPDAAWPSSISRR